jgi:hypothetical protein
MDVHYPPVRNLRSLACLVTVEPPRHNPVPWLRQVLHQQLRNPAVRFAVSSAGDCFAVFLRRRGQLAAMRASPLRVREEDGSKTLVRIRPHDGGDDSFSFSYSYVVCLTFEKLPLEFWDRKGLTIATSGFARLLSVEHAALRGHDYSAIFAMVKVETPAHIPHRLAFHKSNNSGNVADVFINEIWDVRNVAAQENNSHSLPPPPPSRHQPPPFHQRSFHGNHRSRSTRPHSAYTWVRSGTNAPPPTPTHQRYEHGESSNSTVTLPHAALIRLKRIYNF